MLDKHVLDWIGMECAGFDSSFIACSPCSSDTTLAARAPPFSSLAVAQRPRPRHNHNATPPQQGRRPVVVLACALRAPCGRASACAASLGESRQKKVVSSTLQPVRRAVTAKGDGELDPCPQRWSRICITFPLQADCRCSSRGGSTITDLKGGYVGFGLRHATHESDWCLPPSCHSAADVEVGGEGVGHKGPHLSIHAGGRITICYHASDYF